MGEKESVLELNERARYWTERARNIEAIDPIWAFYWYHDAISFMIPEKEDPAVREQCLRGITKLSSILSDPIYSNPALGVRPCKRIK